MKKKTLSVLLALMLCLCACSSTPAATPAVTTATTTSPQTTTTTPAAEETTTTTAAIEPPDPAAELSKLSGSWTQKNEPITFSLASAYHNGTEGKKWAEDEISRMVMDLTGVKLVVTYGSEKLDGGISFYDVLDASGELTDFVYLSMKNDIFRMEESGDAAPLDELALEYCPDFWNELETDEILHNTASDGHVYTLRKGYISNRYYDNSEYPIAYPYPLAIRTDLLKKLGEEMPTSVEELEELLHKAKENMGRLKILTPLIAPNIVNFPVANWMGIENTLTSYGVGATLQWDEENKTIVTSMGDPAWRDYLLKMNRWHQGGLLTLTEYDGDPRGTLGTSTFMAGDSLISFARVSHATNVGSMTFTIRGNEKAQTEPLQPVSIVTEPLTWRGEDLMTAASTRIDYGTNQGGLFISKTCHNPERAILFYQFLNSEYGTKLVHWGIEGIHYTLDEDDHIVMTSENTRAENTDMYGLYDLDLQTDSPVGYWAMVDHPMVRGQFAASPVGVEGNMDIIRARKDLIEAGRNYKNRAREQELLPLEKALPLEGEPTYTDYRRLYNLWLQGVNEMVCTETIDLAEARWTQLQEELAQNGLKELEMNLTHRFVEVMKRYQAEGYYTDIILP